MDLVGKGIVATPVNGRALIAQFPRPELVSFWAWGSNHLGVSGLLRVVEVGMSGDHSGIPGKSHFLRDVGD